jgi:hypothetical protein
VQDARPNGVEFHVSLASEEIGFLLQETGAKSPFPHNTAAPIAAVDVLQIVLAQAFHHDPGSLGLARV